MSILDKIVEMLIKKQWIVFIISLLFATLCLAFIPTDFYDKLPFSSHDVNVVICYSFIALAIFIVIFGVMSMFDKINKSEYRQLQSKKNRAEMLKQLEMLKADNDKLSDRDFSIIMFLVENENKIPYIMWGYFCGNTVLSDERKFWSASYSGESREEEMQTTTGIEKIIVAPSGTQYLLTKEYYDILRVLISETGSITHFSRKRIELNQEEYLQ
jgi:hypothetical protein